MHLSNNIKTLRKRKGLTQEDLSKVLDKTKATISDYEKGKSTPPLEVALQLCDIFNVDLNSLVNRDLEKEAPTGSKAPSSPPIDYRAQYEVLKKQVRTLERVNHLQEQRLADLERMIRKHAPGLAREIGLEK